jgi:hypothetical protein
MAKQQFREDPAMREEIHRKAHKLVRERGDELFGSFGERNSKDSFKAGLHAGYYMGMHEMYLYFIEMANRKAGDD